MLAREVIADVLVDVCPRCSALDPDDRMRSLHQQHADQILDTLLQHGYGLRILESASA